MTKEEFVLQRKIDRLLELLAAVGVNGELAKAAITNPALIERIRLNGIPQTNYCPVCDHPLLFSRPVTLSDMEDALQKETPTFSCEGCGLITER